jgi:hypothetical protein
LRIPFRADLLGSFDFPTLLMEAVALRLLSA